MRRKLHYLTDLRPGAELRHRLTGKRRMVVGLVHRLRFGAGVLFEDGDWLPLRWVTSSYDIEDKTRGEILKGKHYEVNH